MAKQRINPEAAPERIMQPVASPVDLYYRPQPNDFLKIAQGLSSLAPGLANLSNSIIETIARREAVEGAIEGDRLAAMPNTQNGVATMKQPKLAKAIEDSGGISPWRAQSLLESFGRNTVLQQYSRRIEQEFEDLSNPLGPDGQLRPADYAQRRMAEIFTETSAAIPQNSYYARKAAEATRAEVDPVVLYKLGQAYVKKTKEEHERVTIDSMVELLGRKGVDAELELADLGDAVYRTTGKSADFAYGAALVIDGKRKARNGDENATELIEHYLTNGIKGRKLGATIEAQLEQAIDAIGKIEEENLVKGERRKAVAVDSAMDKLYEWAEQMDEVPDGEAFEQKATEILAEIPDGMRADIKGDFLKRSREYRSARLQNEIQVRAMETDQSTIEYLNDQIFNLPEQEAKALIDGAYQRGDIDRGTYANLRQVVRAKKDIPDGLATHAASEVQKRVTGGMWAGTLESQVPPDMLPKFREVESQIEARFRIEQITVANDPKFTAEQNPAVRTARMQEELSNRLNRIVAEARTENKELLAYSNTSAFYSTRMKDIVARESAVPAVEMVMSMMDVTEADGAGNKNKNYFILAQSIEEQVAAEGRRWFDRAVQSGMPLIQVQEAWDLSGRAAVRDAVVERYRDLDWIQKNLQPYVRDAIPRAYTDTKRKAAVGYEEFLVPALAQSSLSRIRSENIQEPFSWRRRLFNSDIDFSEAIGEAQTAAADYAKTGSPESKKRYEASLAYMGSVSDNVIRSMSESKEFKFLPGGVGYVGMGWSPDDNPQMGIVWKVNEGMTRTYWAMKSVKGLSRQERSQARTEEGVTIPDAMFTPKMKLFRDRTDFENALKTGEVDRIIERARKGGWDGTRDAWVAEQIGVIQALTPEPTKTDTTPRPSSGLEVILD